MSPIRVVCAPRPRSVVSESARRVALSRLILRFTTARFCYARSRNSQKARSFFPAGRKVGQKHDPAQQLTRHARHIGGRARNGLARRANTAPLRFFAGPTDGAFVRADGVSARRRFAGRGLLGHGWHRWFRRARRHVWLRHVGSCSTELVSRLCAATPPHGAMLCRIRCTDAVVWLRWAVPGHERRPPL